MNKVHFSEDVFIDTIELNRFNDFIFEDAVSDVIKNNVGGWGIVKNNKFDPNFTAFKMSQGSAIGGKPTVVVQGGSIVGWDGTLGQVLTMKNTTTDPIIVADDSAWYWVKVSYATKTIEKGTVAVDVNGNVIGSGTEFSTILRGQPNFPSKIRFYKKNTADNYSLIAATNNSEYEVLEVTNATTMILQGTFTAETNLYYEIIGTFTPGFTVDSANKGVFRYDNCLIEFVAESPIDGNPTKPSYTPGEEFLIYRIKSTAGTVTFEDYRNEVFYLKQDFEAKVLPNTPIPNIGLTSMSFESTDTPQTKSLAKVEWGYRSSNFTIDSATGIITLTNGSGGKFKTNNDFTTGDFNGFILYVLDTLRDNNGLANIEKCYKIITSSKSSSTIVLTLESFSPLDVLPEMYYASTTYTNKDRVNTVSNDQFELQIDTATGVTPLCSTVWNVAVTYASGDYVLYNGNVYGSLSSGNVGNNPATATSYWELTWLQVTTELLIVPNCENIIVQCKVGDDVTSTYTEQMVEVSFPVQLGYGIIPLTGKNLVGSAEENYLVYNIQYRKTNGKAMTDLFVLPSDSVGYVDETSTPTPYTITATYKDKAFVKAKLATDGYLAFKNKVDSGDVYGVEIVNFADEKPLYTLTAGTDKKYQVITAGLSSTFTSDYYINLAPASTPKDGATFIIEFKNVITMGSYKLRIVQDYVSVSSYTLLKEFTEYETSMMTTDAGIYIMAVYSTVTSTWKISGYHEKLTALDGNPVNNFNGEPDEYDVSTIDDINFASMGTDYIAYATGGTVSQLDGLTFRPVALILKPEKKYYRITHNGSEAGVYNYLICMFHSHTNQKYGDEIVIELDNDIPTNGVVCIYSIGQSFSTDPSHSGSNIKLNNGIYEQQYLKAFVANPSPPPGGYSKQHLNETVKLIKFIYSPSKDVATRSGEWKEIHRTYLFS